MFKNLTLEMISEMNLEINDKDALNKAQSDKMRIYAESHGFYLHETRKIEGQNAMYVYYHSSFKFDDGTPLNVNIPASQDFKDYPLRVKEFIRYMIDFSKAEIDKPQTELQILDKII